MAETHTVSFSNRDKELLGFLKDKEGNPEYFTGNNIRNQLYRLMELEAGQ